MTTRPLARAEAFCTRFGLRIPVLAAPMAGACPPELAAAVAGAGGMGAAGVLLDPPDRIAQWVARFRAAAGPDAALQLNNWIPDPIDDAPDRVAAAQAHLARHGDPGPEGPPAPRFDEQWPALLDAAPTAVSTIMGVLDERQVGELRQRGIAWFACATTLDEARAAQAAGADAVVAQGVEAGGHRGTFDPAAAHRVAIGLFALLPHLVDHLDVPVIAAGGVADGRGLAAALTLGASAVQVGTALLRTPEADIDPAWAATLAELAPQDPVLTRAYSGRLGRAAPTPFVTGWTDAAAPAPYPQQRALVARWRRGEATGLDPVNLWAGQNAAMATTEPAADLLTRMWSDARHLLS